ncbi:hypothetical protein [Paenibacillus glacialis]|uniref:Uncharacterized protein n=1 Tax=Paenibacillus glacialis TaxID=494026 RepID=A0A168HQT8_9BACL|nr:hypothetical protein [Paenibacillus glacialis]OAB38432.1 hypothetical protein PGLA_20280 [Paenibacillus glacialis]
MKKNVPANKETTLHTQSKEFNNNSKGTNPERQFKRYGVESHAGLSLHVHQPTRNKNKEDISQLYDYLKNGKYRE